MNTAPGALASSYLPATKPTWSIAQRKIAVDATHTLSTVSERVIEFVPDAGCVATLGKWDSKYFSEAPEVSLDGTITFAASGCGGDTAVEVVILDLAEVGPTGEFARLGVAAITVSVETRTMLKRPVKDSVKRPNRMASVSPHSPGRNINSSQSMQTPGVAGSGLAALRSTPNVMQSGAAAVLPPPRTTIQLPDGTTSSPGLSSSTAAHATGGRATSDLTGLTAPSVRVHRAPPPRATQRSFSAYLLSITPMLLMRQWNYHAEYVLLSDARGTPEQAVALLKRIQTAMEQGQVVEAVVPLIDAACRLHVALGGQANLKTAVRLAHLRVQAVGTAVGIDMRAKTPLEVSSAQRLASARKETVEMLIRVLVESAHLMKLTGAYADALRYYKTAATIAATQNAAALSSATAGSAGNGGSASGATQIPFLIAAADTHFLSGDLPSAVKLYEEARAHAEVASRGGSVVAECEQQLAFVFSLSGQVKEAEIAARRALSIRKEQADSTATAEALLFEGSGLAARGKVAQAAQCVLRARNEARQDGERAAFVRVVAEVLAGVLATFADCHDLDWDDAAALDCPDDVVRSFAKWLRVVHNNASDAESAAAIAAILGELEPTVGPDALVVNLLRLSLAVASANEDSAAAHMRASTVVDSIGPQLAPLHPFMRLSVEVATWTATAAEHHTTALGFAERLVWFVTDAPQPVSYNEAFRISAVVAEAATHAPTADGSSLPHVETMYSKLFEVAGDAEGHFSPKIVALLLDAAEVRHVKADFSAALELFAKALRIVDAKNLLYLIGPLYQPAWMLSQQELRDRDRLCGERHPGLDGLTSLAMVLQQLGLTHEAGGHTSKAVAALQQSVATFELARIEHHPGSLDALVNLGRCHLSLREQATARVYLERADTLFLDHFHDFGRYVSTSPSSVLLRAKIDAGLRACRVSEKAEGTLLCRGHPSNPVLDALQLYL
jgi:tetratricopeptide (TPR) repeat protein